MISNHTAEQRLLVCLSLFITRSMVHLRLPIYTTEFTQHQRDVFCVFSGNMVSKFRDFLNTSPLFEDLRESFSPRAGGRIRGAVRRANGIPSAIPQADSEAFDDDMADEDNDFEGLDGSDMVVDVQAQNTLPFHNTNLQGSTTGPPYAQMIPIPPPAPSLGQHPFAPANHPQQQHPFLQSTQEAMGTIAFSSFRSNEPASGTPPLSAHGHAHASIAGMSQQSTSQQASLANGGSSAGASTAPLHRGQQDETAESPATDQN